MTNTQHDTLTRECLEALRALARAYQRLVLDPFNPDLLRDVEIIRTRYETARAALAQHQTADGDSEP